MLLDARLEWQNLRTSEFLDSGDYMLITGTDFEDGTINYSTCDYVEKERYEQDKKYSNSKWQYSHYKGWNFRKIGICSRLNNASNIKCRSV